MRHLRSRTARIGCMGRHQTFWVAAIRQETTGGMKRADYDNLKETPVRSGVTRRVFTGDGATLAWTKLDPGHAPRPHSHSYEQIVYIISGRVRFTVGDESAEIGPGGMLVVPPNVEHYAETIGDEPALDLSIFTPRREEYAAEEQFI
jgi:quercetin dioxygenase-like cupin family protein